MGGPSVIAGSGGTPDDALAAVLASIDVAWEDLARDHGVEDESAMARRVIADPSAYPWRVVDAALDRVTCGGCGRTLGAGPQGCPPCDLAHGFRFAGREIDRPGVPPGNEHAIRVATAVLRAPHRYPAWAVAANRVHLELFLGGDMPTRREQELMLAAARRDVAVNSTGAGSFRELAARAEAALAAERELRPRG